MDERDPCWGNHGFHGPTCDRWFTGKRLSQAVTTSLVLTYPEGVLVRIRILLRRFGIPTSKRCPLPHQNPEWLHRVGPG